MSHYFVDNNWIILFVEKVKRKIEEQEEMRRRRKRWIWEIYIEV